ncbi:MAG TPA: hypothetical protein VIK49_01590 [Steroidobacteraceae bacterium]
MTTFNRNYRTAATLAAVVIVGLTGLTLDRGHEGALPRGTIEIGKLETVMVGDMNIASLPAVVVIGSRTVQLADVVATDADNQG